MKQGRTYSCDHARISIDLLSVQSLHGLTFECQLQQNRTAANINLELTKLHKHFSKFKSGFFIAR